MHRTRLIIKAAAAVILLFAGSSAINYASQGGTAVDVCALLPREEAGKILGTAVRARSEKRSDGATECVYAGAMPGSVTVMVGAGTPKARWDEFMTVLKESGAELEPAAGIGDGAYFWDANRLYAHTTSYQITVSTSQSPGDDLAKVRANAVALAKAIIAKLKG